MKIGFIGTGVIATAMVQGIAADPHEIVVSERSRANSAELAATFSNVSVGTNQEVIDRSDVIIIGLLEPVANEVLPGLDFRPGQIVFSVMVGVSTEALIEWVAPAAFDGVFIPFPHVATGDSPILACPGSPTLDAIFGGRNEMIAVPSESILNHFLAAQAILCPTVQVLSEAGEWLTERVGDAAAADTFIRVLVGSYLMGGGKLNGLVDALGTEGGLNAQMRDHFAANRVYESVHTGLDQLERRLRD